MIRDNQKRFSKYLNKDIFIKLTDGFIYKGILKEIGDDFLEIDDIKSGLIQINPRELMIIKLNDVKEDA